MLVSAKQLERLIDNGEVLVVDCRYNLADSAAGQQGYLLSHIPGAFYVHLSEEMSAAGPAAAGRHPLPSAALFLKALQRIGVTPETAIVAYDDSGGLMAARFWWLCHALGFDNVLLLDGGWQAWLTLGLRVESGSANYPAQVTPLCPASFQLSRMVSTQMLEQGLADRSLLLVDARSAARYRGDEEPIDPVAGHIPGALNRPATDNLDSEQCFLSAEQLRSEWQSLLGEYAPEVVVHSCGSGVTACHNLFAMEMAGLPGSRLYAPSWSGWISDPGHGYVVGAEADNGTLLLCGEGFANRNGR